MMANTAVSHSTGRNLTDRRTIVTTVSRVLAAGKQAR